MPIFKKSFLIFVLFNSLFPSILFAYDFGDYRSETLVTKAWDALAQNDFKAVLAYTEKCESLYAIEASKMQKSLSDYPSGSNDIIFSYWALNDVATALYIQAEAYFKENRKEEARSIYQRIVDEFGFGLCWDPKGWFWKPAEAAKEKLEMINKGIVLDYGDYTSSTLTLKAWEALAEGNFHKVFGYTNKCIQLYGEKARQMQQSLKNYPIGKSEEIHAYWALNDVSTCLFIQAQMYQKSKMTDEAKKIYQQILDQYSFGQCFDPKGWFWKPADAARDYLAMAQANIYLDYGDYTSATLVNRAWQALSRMDHESALRYANKCITLYSQEAKKMQKSLADYPSGSNNEKFAYWALNDVATAHFIKGVAFKQLSEFDKSIEEFNTIKKDFTFGQVWDPKGWWWRPSEAADEWLVSMQIVNKKRKKK